MEQTWSTEQRNPRTMHIDTMGSGELVDLIVDEDAASQRAVAAVTGPIAAAVDAAVTAIRRGGCVHVLGAGTSGRLAVLDAVELYPTYGVGPETWVGHIAGGQAAMLAAVEGAEDDESAGAAIVLSAGEDDLIVGVAASGRTPFVRGAMATARNRGLTTVLISSNPAAPLTDLADIAIQPDTGPEVVTGSTRMKAGSAQKLVLNTLSTATMVRLGHTWSNLMIDVVATNEKLRRRMVGILMEASGRDEAACAEALDAVGGSVRRALELLGDATLR